MAGVEPMDLSAAVHAVALTLSEARVEVVGLAGRRTYTFESNSAVVTVSVHLDSAQDIDQVADLLDMDRGDLSQGEDLYSRGGHQHSGVYVSLFGPPHRPASVVGVAS